MLIRVTTRACGRLSFAPGQVIDLAPPDALQLIDAGAAVAVPVLAATPDVLPIATDPETVPELPLQPQPAPEPKPRRRKK